MIFSQNKEAREVECCKMWMTPPLLNCPQFLGVREDFCLYVTDDHGATHNNRETRIE